MKNALLLFSFVAASTYAQTNADVARGERLFRTKCAACHSIACNRNGPKLEGVFGRQAAGVIDFKGYTNELRESKVVWSEQTMDEYIADPGKMVPGTSMVAAGRMDVASERRDVIAHVRRQDKSIDLCL